MGPGADRTARIRAGQRLQAPRLHRGHRDTEGFGPQVRVPVRMGLRPPVGARALPGRGAFQAPRHSDQLSQGDQGFLHEAERRRQDRTRNGRLVPRNRRDYRRFGARGRLWQTLCKGEGTRYERAGTLVVPRYAPLGLGSALRIRSGLRPAADLRDGPYQHPRCAAFPAHAAARRFLKLRIENGKSGSGRAVQTGPHGVLSPALRRAGAPRADAGRDRRLRFFILNY